MLRFIKLTLVLAFLASFLVATVHTHEDSHNTSSIHESCSLCLQNGRNQFIDSPGLVSSNIDEIVLIFTTTSLVQLDWPISSINFASISLRGPPSHFS